MDSWSEDDVCTFLVHLHLNTLIPAFRANHVDGSLLSEINDGDLVEMGVSNSLMRKKLLISIRKNLDQPPPSNDIGYMTVAGANAAVGRVPEDSGYMAVKGRPEDGNYVDIDEIREQVHSLNAQDQRGERSSAGGGAGGGVGRGAADEESAYMEMPNLPGGGAGSARAAAAVGTEESTYMEMPALTPISGAGRGAAAASARGRPGTEESLYMELPEGSAAARAGAAAAAAGAAGAGEGEEAYGTSDFHGNVEELLVMFPGIGRHNVEKCLRINQGKVQATIDMLLALNAEDTTPAPAPAPAPAAQTAIRASAPAPVRTDRSGSVGRRPHTTPDAPLPAGSPRVTSLPYPPSQYQQSAYPPPTGHETYSEMPQQESGPRWLHGVVSRQHAEDLLKMNGLGNGMFLVRRRVENPRSFAISLANQGAVFHHRISNDYGGVEFLGMQFASLPDLVVFLSGRHPEVGWMTPLTNSVPNTYTLFEDGAREDRDDVTNPMFTSPRPVAQRSPRALRREDFDLEDIGVPNYLGDQKFIVDVTKSPETMRMTLPFDARGKCRCILRTTVSSVDFYDGTESTLFGALLLVDLTTIEAQGRVLRLVADGTNAGVYYLELERAEEVQRLVLTNQKNWLEHEDQRLAKLLQSDEFLLRLRESEDFTQALAEEELHVNVGGQLNNPKLQRALGYSVAQQEGVVEEDFAQRVKSSSGDKTRKMIRKMASVFRRDRSTHAVGAPSKQSSSFDLAAPGPATPAVGRVISGPTAVQMNQGLPSQQTPAPAAAGVGAGAGAGVTASAPAPATTPAPAPAQPPGYTPLPRTSSVLGDSRPARVAPPPPPDQVPMRSGRRRSSETTPPSAGSHASHTRYVAMQNNGPFPYDPTALTFLAGDVVLVTTKNESGTWLGECNGRRGHFPCTLVSPVEDEPPPPFDAWEEPAHLGRDSLAADPREGDDR